MSKLTMSIYDIYIHGYLTTAEKKGVLRPEIIKYCKIKTRFLNYRMMFNYNDSVARTAAAMNCSERTVKRAITVVSK